MNVSHYIVLVDKPKGITSHTAVQRIKKKYNAKKAGHAGTLDPMATGLLIVGLDEGTKKLKEYVGLDKTYEADILVGVKTDTGDIEGAVQEEKKVQNLSNEEVQEVIAGLVGTRRLSVPQYAATKVRGTPLYKLAREGKEVPNVVRDMEITEALFTDLVSENDSYVISCVLSVSSGTYVRSIAEYIGELLGYPATLSGLRRTKVGEFEVGDAITL